MTYDVLYIDHGNPEADQNYLKLKEKVPSIFFIFADALSSASILSCSTEREVVKYMFSYCSNSVPKLKPVDELSYPELSVKSDEAKLKDP